MRWTRPLPAVGDRIHQALGDPPNITDWSGEVRAIVDDEWLVVRVWSRRKQTWRYRIEWRYFWEQGAWQPGPLPKSRMVAADD